MKSLVRHIKDNESSLISLNEKLVINKNFKAAKTNDDVLMDLINVHLKNYMNINYETLFKGSIKASLEISLINHGIRNDFDKVNEFIKLNDKMQKYKVTYRYVYDPENSHSRSLNNRIDKLFDDINKNDIELKEMWKSTKNNYYVKYYECNKFILLWVGSSNFGHVYIAMN